MAVAPSAPATSDTIGCATGAAAVVTVASMALLGGADVPACAALADGKCPSQHLRLMGLESMSLDRDIPTENHLHGVPDLEVRSYSSLSLY
ncbi:hypothetical protein BCR41DRAFT_394332 [Lobosporangium transversale]|uniref:Uncharacterized protein n=1 Tax=Lobosporangium transversale TaxID=64571 RepID=A0A1Y2GTE2_9FUNG|nr:hypothetical protein BCR41DRAFT_394332 [Lobosporangium transversale]ORZ22756.1 hypothetical protein BCR41DRAFT_394332 [Lobosporangium transversale]|eukprot:XP_021883310.1 hypothetical protein BCR41DRAFT_394332 [Lobosporangium transversale]